jgi:hypothetical protein
MNLQYYGGKIKLVSLGSDSTIVIEKLTSCGDDTQREEIYRTTLTNKTEFEYELEDGRYIITVTRGINGSSTIEEETISIEESFLQSLLEDVKLVLLGCGCPTCDDCDNFSHQDMRDLIVKLTSYFLIQNKYYSQAIETVLEKFYCEFQELNRCLLLHESVYGNGENMLLFKKIVAFYYNVLIEGEVLNSDIANLDEIKERFDYEKVKVGLRRLGM